MRFSFPFAPTLLTVLTVVFAWIVPGTASAQPKPEQIRISEPSSPMVTSNLSGNSDSGLERLNPSPSGLKQVQDDLFRPLENSLQSGDSMQGIITLPQPVAPSLSRHSRELIDQRKNWAFTDLKDLYPENSTEDMLGVKNDGAGKSEVSVIQRFYESMGQKSPSNPIKTGEYDPTGAKQYSLTNGLQLLSRSFPASDQFTKVLFSGAPAAFTGDPLSELTRGNSDDNQVISGENDELKASQKRLAAFRQVLDANPQMIGIPGGLNGTSAEDVARRATISQPYHSSISPILGTIDPTAIALHGHVNDDPTAAALGLPDPVKWKPAPKSAESFQQMLDPFSAGRTKPKF